MICSCEGSYLLVGLLSSAGLRLCRFIVALHHAAPAFGALAAGSLQGAMPSTRAYGEACVMPSRPVNFSSWQKLFLKQEDGRIFKMCFSRVNAFAHLFII
jgi:hypothetical protein